MKPFTLIRGPTDESGLVENANPPPESAPPDYSYLTSAVRFDPYLLEDTTYTLEELRRARGLHPSSGVRSHLELRSVS